MTNESAVCFKCKKIVMVPIKCKCGNVSCLSHRFEKHDCKYDFKQEQIKHLTKDMEKISGNKNYSGI